MKEIKHSLPGRLLAVLLTLVMVVSCCGTAVLAAEAPGPNGAETGQSGPEDPLAKDAQEEPPAEEQGAVSDPSKPSEEDNALSEQLEVTLMLRDGSRAVLATYYRHEDDGLFYADPADKTEPIPGYFDSREGIEEPRVFAGGEGYNIDVVETGVDVADLLGALEAATEEQAGTSLSGDTQLAFARGEEDPVSASWENWTERYDPRTWLYTGVVSATEDVKVGPVLALLASYVESDAPYANAAAVQEAVDNALAGEPEEVSLSAFAGLRENPREDREELRAVRVDTLVLTPAYEAEAGEDPADSVPVSDETPALAGSGAEKAEDALTPSATEYNIRVDAPGATVTPSAAQSPSGQTVTFTVSGSTVRPRVQTAGGKGVAVTKDEAKNEYVFSMPGEDVTIIVRQLTKWTGAADTSWYDAAPNATSYTITTAEQLAGLAKLVNGTLHKKDGMRYNDYKDKSQVSFAGVTINLDADLDLGGELAANTTDSTPHPWKPKNTALNPDPDPDLNQNDPQQMTYLVNWTPIGGRSIVAGQANSLGGDGIFCGTFNGNGHLIDNLYIKDYHPSYWRDAIGLFGNIAGTVKDLTVDGYIYANRGVGGIVGRTSKTLPDKETLHGPALISNCRNFATLYNTDSKGVGGIVGAGVNQVTVTDCINYGNATTSYSQGNVGGIVGELEGDVTNCANYGEVKAIGATDRGLGGIVGALNATPHRNSITGCVNYGTLSSHGSMGGIVGRRYDASPLTITDCYNRGEIKGTYMAGSTIGLLDAYRQAGIIAYIGSARDVTIANCYNEGALSSTYGARDCYAIVGFVTEEAKSNYVTILNSYGKTGQAAAPDTSLLADCEYAQKTEAEMQDAAFAQALLGAYIPDSFGTDGNVWVNGGFPLLYWQNPEINAEKYTVSVHPDVDPENSAPVGGTLQVTPKGEQRYYTRVTLEAEPLAGFLLVNYTVSEDGGPAQPLSKSDNKYVITTNTVFGAVFRSVAEKKLYIDDAESNPGGVKTHAITVTKTSGCMKDAQGTFTKVDPKAPNPPVLADGDDIFEGDVIKVEAALTQAVNDTEVVSDLTMEYNGEFTMTVNGAAQVGNNVDGIGYEADGTTDVAVSATPQTGLKSWKTLADTSWYDAAPNADSYTLETTAQLAGLAKVVNEYQTSDKKPVTFEGKTIALKSTVQNNGAFSLLDTRPGCTGIQRYWNSIGGNGDAEKVFKGTFDGGGLEILEFALFNSKNAMTGLFGYAEDAVIRNFTLTGSAAGTTLTNNDTVGFVAGKLNHSVVQDVICTGTLVGSGKNGSLGGLVGNAMGNSSVNRCRFGGSVTGAGAMLGGIAGTVEVGSQVRFCVNSGTVTEDLNMGGSNYTGGVAGFLNGVAQQCVNTGAVTSGNLYAGGIAGYVNNTNSKIDNCYNRGEVDHQSNIANHAAGGLAGYLQRGAVVNSYTTGAVSQAASAKSQFCGRALGRLGTTANSVTLTNNFFVGTTSAEGLGDGVTRTGVTGLDVASLQGAAAQLGAAYTADTGINGGYPVLLWQVGDSEVMDQIFKITSMTAEPKTASLNVKGAKEMSVIFAPATALDQRVAWSSSDTAVAAVDAKGVVTGVKAGTATLTATALGDDTFTDEIVITILQPAEKLDLNKTALTLNKGASFDLQGIFTPADTSNKGLTWYTSKPSVARVAAGKVTAVKSGQATISAITRDGTYLSKSCVVTVVTPNKGVSLDAKTKTLNTGTSFTLSATIAPGDADNQKVTWNSNNKTAVRLTPSGDGKQVKVTGLARGTATVTALAAGFKAQCTVTVNQPVTEVKMSKAAVTLTGKGKTAQLSAIIAPTNANNRAVKWSSSKSAVVAVSTKGKLTAKAQKGSATITAKARDGSGKKATCKVYIGAKTTKAKLNITKKTLAVGSGFTLKATLTPGKAVNKTVVWSTSKASVATVSTKGKVTAKGVGSATITAAAQDSGKKATCKVMVKAKVKSVELNKAEATLEKGKTLALKAVISPANSLKEVTWTSSNPKVAKISSTGKVSAVNKGTAKITVKTISAGKKATCMVKVK